ncbi:hypothetical protein F8M41_015157 [Gigaspora margarita]|uniref:Uncharacterized protein n=1 Tax=Gigaspora margarita TaxID=4874 RepID=A0A8H4AQW0_GIGMA|nr:hypothetical protein F8M41_015157 [Gigaspora margarita]
MNKAMKKISSKSKSSRHKTKSKSRIKKKKLSKRIYAHIILDESSSDSSDSENSMTSSENELETNTLACSWNESESSSSQNSESSNSESDSEKYKPKEVFFNGYNMINAEFIALKDSVLNHFTSNFSDKEREKFWHEITIISSLLEKIVQVPSAMIDSGANCLVISKGLIKLLEAEVDKNKKPSVKWYNNFLESSGISYNISVTVGQGENSCTISEDFLVMDDDKL